MICHLRARHKLIAVDTQVCSFSLTGKEVGVLPVCFRLENHLLVSKCLGLIEPLSGAGSLNYLVFLYEISSFKGGRGLFYLL
jgi:hypothetical protein